MLNYLYGFIPYEELNVTLSTMPGNYRDGRNNGIISIYIDLQSVYKRLFAQNIPIDSCGSLTANVLNLAGHWKHYFKSRWGKNTIIYLVNTVTDENHSISDMQNSNTDLFSGVGTICKYIPNVYYIYVNNNLNFSVYTYASIYQNQSYYKNNMNFIITNDTYAYQLPMIPNTYVYRLSSRVVVDRSNAISLWRRKAYLADLDSGLLPLLMAYTHDTKLKLPKYYDIRKATKLIRDHIAHGDIKNGYNNPLAIKSVLDYDNTQQVIDEDFSLIGRYRKCDLIQQYYEASHNGKLFINPTWQVKKYVSIQTFANATDKTFNATGNVVNVNFLFDT